MKKEQKNENNNNCIDDDNENLYLDYIKIDNTNKIAKLEDDIQSQILMDLINSAVTFDKDDNVGQELNKFFIKLLPENKDGDILKANYALYKIIRKNSGLKA